VPTTRFLFWNINRKPLADFVGQIAHARAAEVVILAECEIDAADLVRTLNQRAPGGFHYSPGANRTFSVFVRFSPQFLQPRFGSDRGVDPASFFAGEIPGPAGDGTPAEQTLLVWR